MKPHGLAAGVSGEREEDSEATDETLTTQPTLQPIGPWCKFIPGLPHLIVSVDAQAP